MTNRSRRRRIRQAFRRRAPHTRPHLNPQLTAVILCLVCSVVFAVWLGNHLGSKVTSPYDIYAPSTEGAGNAPALHAGFLRTDDLTGTNATDRINGRIATMQDVCLSLYGADGTVLYYSGLSQSLGQVTGATLNLPAVVEHLHAGGHYVCGAVTLSAFEEEEPLRRSVLLTYEEALIREIADSGLDEILLLGLPTGNEHRDEIYGFLEELGTYLTDTHLSVAVDLNGSTTEESKTLLTRLSVLTDAMALDLRQESTASLSEALDRWQDTVTRYRMRILLAPEEGDTPGRETEALIDTVTGAGWIVCPDQ